MLVGYDGYKHVKGTKIHAVVSPEALPPSLQVGPGDEHDSKRFIKLLEGVRVKHGRPKEVMGDSAYDAREIRAYLKRRGIKANIDVNPRNRRKPKRGRPYRFNKKSYRSMRSAVERFFAWITAFRRITIRYERLASTFLALIQVACIIIYLRVLQ
ncbi:MAG: IS5 family transposase [Candidatus Nezhaarchaeales archaeon]